MKTAFLFFIIPGSILFSLSCRERREGNLTSLDPLSKSALGTDGELPRALGKIDPKYGQLDAEGFPIDSDFGMNSGKITNEQFTELRQPPPKGYQIGPPTVAKYIKGRANDIKWENVEKRSLRPENENLLADLLGLEIDKIPPRFRGTVKLLKSPLNDRIIVDMGSSTSLLEAKGGMIDLSSEKKLYCVNFDDKRRAFISWDAFVNESLIVGHLADDEDIEILPSRQILYTYNIEKNLLRRVIFPQEIQKEEWEAFSIDSVANSTILIRWDKMQNLTTIYLDE